MALFNKLTVKRLIAKSNEISKPRYIGFALLNRSDISQAPVKFQNDTISLSPSLVAFRVYQIVW